MAAPFTRHLLEVLQGSTSRLFEYFRACKIKFTSLDTELKFTVTTNEIKFSSISTNIKFYQTEE